MNHFFTGLVSVTFRTLSPLEIIRWVQKSGLEALEWGGDIHVPHGNLRVANEVARLTGEHGLEVAAYGSYYRAGESEREGLSFISVLETAKALEAPMIRVWAGRRASGDADSGYRQRVIDDLFRITVEAASAGIQVATEFHSNTLADESSSLIALLEAINHPNLRTLWQPPVGRSEADCLDDLRRFAPWLTNLHVYHWDANAKRLPLSEGRTLWNRYLKVAGATSGRHGLLMEFVRDQSPEAFLEDARTLRSMLREASHAPSPPSSATP